MHGWTRKSQVVSEIIRLTTVCVSPDGFSDRVQGEHPGWGAEGTASQHGLQPERPLPPALFCYSEGTGI